MPNKRGGQGERGGGRGEEEEGIEKEREEGGDLRKKKRKIIYIGQNSNDIIKHFRKIFLAYFQKHSKMFISPDSDCSAAHSSAGWRAVAGRCSGTVVPLQARAHVLVRSTLPLPAWLRATRGVQ